MFAEVAGSNGKEGTKEGGRQQRVRPTIRRLSAKRKMRVKRELRGEEATTDEEGMEEPRLRNFTTSVATAAAKAEERD